MTYEEALGRSITALKIAGMFGVPVQQVMRDKADRREMKRNERLNRKHKAQAEFLASDEPFALTMADVIERQTDEKALAKWCALPLTYGNDPRSVMDRRCYCVNLRDRAAVRTLGGVADYSSTPEAA